MRARGTTDKVTPSSVGCDLLTSKAYPAGLVGILGGIPADPSFEKVRVAVRQVQHACTSDSEVLPQTGHS
jgi:hypothetical protein